jgi:hypothetical protein
MGREYSTRSIECQGEGAQCSVGMCNLPYHAQTTEVPTAASGRIVGKLDIGSLRLRVGPTSCLCVNPGSIRKEHTDHKPHSH